MPQVFFETLGCAKNEVDSRDMADRLRQAGFTVTDELQESDVAIVNTCSFIRAATEESIDAVLDIASLDEGAVRRPLILCGCMASRYGADLAEALPEADRFVPCSQEDDIVAVVCEALGIPVSTGQVTAAASAPVWAYLKISDGCDRWCSFCTIPLIRGRYHSFPLDRILEQAQDLARRGTKEIVLIGQDTGIWGQDLEGDQDIAWLLEQLAQKLPAVRFRLMYTEPEGVTERLLTVMAAHPNICSYLDIPLQHVTPRILSAMHREGSAEGFRKLVERVRETLPDVTLRTTLMTGFPGETEEDFEELLSFVGEGLFQYVGVFAYSPEEGTRAAELPDQVPEEIKQMRARELRDLADSVSSSLISLRVGSTQEVLVEGAEEDGQLFGRAACQAPEVDGVTFLDRGAVGDVLSVCISDTLLYDMEGEA